MRRTEYYDDVILFNSEPIETIIHDESVWEPFDPDTLDPESWQDWFSEDLLNMYFEVSGCTFNEFCNFMYANRKNDGLYIPENFGSSRTFCDFESRRPAFPAIDEVRKHGVVTYVNPDSRSGPRYTVLGHCKVRPVQDHSDPC